MKTAYTIIRLLLGTLFILSGWVKAIDPVGTLYKLNDYFAMFDINGFDNLSASLAVILCGLELFVGLMLLFNFARRVISYIAFLFMAFFTVFTFIVLIIPDMTITECGCFGDAIALTNMETFLKNILFVIPSFFYARDNFMEHKRSKMTSDSYYYLLTTSPIVSRKIFISRCLVHLYVILVSFFVPICSLMYLPPYDYLAFNRDVNILNDMKLPADADVGESITELVYENKQTKEKRNFQIEDVEWQDNSKWSYVDTKTTVIREGTKPLIDAFAVIDSSNIDVAQTLFNKKGYAFIIVAQQMQYLKDEDFKLISQLNKIKNSSEASMAFLTATELRESAELLKNNGLNNIPIYNVDINILKSFVRSDRGIVLLEDGTIKGKWNFRTNTLKNINYSDMKILVEWEEYALIRYIILVVILMVIMIFLSYIYYFNFWIR